MLQSDSVSQHIDKKRLVKASAITLPDTLGHVAGTLIPYYLFEHYLQASHVFLWVLMVLATFFLRMITYALLKRGVFNPTTQQWEYILTGLSIISASAWGSLVFFIPENTVYSLTIACIFFACIGGALGAVGNHFPVFTAFATPISLLLTIHFLMHGGILFISMALVTISYTIACVYISYRFTKTSRKESILNEQNKQLVKQLSHEKEQAEKANAEKSRFLAAANHDLRQPLQAMNLFIEALYQDLETSHHQVLLMKLRESMHSMNELLSSLLDMSKLDAGLIHVHKDGFFILPLLEKVYSQFKQQVSRDVELYLPKVVYTTQGHTASLAMSDVIVRSDPVLLESIVRNLLSNALKYTKQGQVSMQCVQREEGNYILTIKDTGIGIAPEEQERVFDAFYQVGNTSRDRNKGIGLGLSIVKHTCQLLQHKLTMHSEINRGTCFEIYLPMANKVTLVSSTTSVIPTFNMDILIVDDDQAILDGMQAMISRWGCTVFTANSQVQASITLKEHASIRLLLVDYRLQDGCTGIHVIKEARKILKQPRLPGIIITGDTSPNILQTIESEGFHTLHKPIKPAQLRTLMRHLLE